MPDIDNRSKKGPYVMSYEKIPFQESEMLSGEEYRMGGPGAPGILKPAYPISPRENFERTRHGDPVWLPSDTEMMMFAPATIGENVARGMVIDTMRVSPDQFGGKDYFGVEWRFVPEQRGSMVVPGNPLMDDASEWKEKVVFPDISSWDWEECAKRNAPLLNQGRMIKIPFYTGFFERLVSFMDMEGALIALVDEDQQEDVKELFDALASFYIELISYMKKYFNIDVIWFHDDWGSQRAPIFSYETARDMILPYLKKVVDGAHKEGVIFEFHSCGKLDPLVPLIVESGADMWDGQNMNDKETLSRTYAGKLMVEIEAPVDPDMTDEEIHEYVKGILDKFPKGIFLGKTFKADPRLTPIAYEESRRRYSL